MFLSQNMVTLIPKSPYKHIEWSQHVSRWTAADRSDGDGDTRVSGAGGGLAGRGGVERSRNRDRPRESEGGVGHMLAPADDTAVTRWRRGETGGRGRLITPTSDVMADALSSTVCLDLIYCIPPFYAKFPPPLFICYFDSVLQVKMAFSGAVVKSSFL